MRVSNQRRLAIFFAIRRNHLEEDGEYSAQKIKSMHAAFGGRRRATDFFSLNPVLMSNDIAPVKGRKLVAEEQRIKVEKAS